MNSYFQNLCANACSATQHREHSFTLFPFGITTLVFVPFFVCRRAYIDAPKRNPTLSWFPPSTEDPTYAHKTRLSFLHRADPVGRVARFILVASLIKRASRFPRLSGVSRTFGIHKYAADISGFKLCPKYKEKINQGTSKYVNRFFNKSMNRQ